MGRNAIPKLGEWRDGRLYSFMALDSYSRKDAGPPQPDDGRMIVYERQNAPYMHVPHSGETETLATCFADGFQECLAAMWESGYSKGEKAGYEKAKREIRSALGVCKDSA